MIVTKRWNSQLAGSMREEYKNERTKVSIPLNLTGWGGKIVKRDAILRQVTPEVRESMEKDPTFVPPGPFNFQPSDVISDESNTIARYDAARELFEQLDKRAGRKSLQNWLKGVWVQGAGLNMKEIATPLGKQLNVYVMEHLK